MQGSRSPWYLRVGSGYRCVRLVQAWDSDEETSVHRGLQDHRKTNRACTSGIGANMMPQSLGKASCPAVDSRGGMRSKWAVQRRPEGNTKTFLHRFTIPCQRFFSHINPAHVPRHHLKKKREKDRNSGRWTFTPVRLN